MEDVVSAWALKGTEERVPGDENSKTEGTETGNRAPLPEGTTILDGPAQGVKREWGVAGWSVVSG